jgi:hypothetical protein
MLISNFSRHIFWSYKKGADLPDDIVIKQVISYGELSDIITLTTLYRKDMLRAKIKKFYLSNKKRANFILKVFL